MRLDRLQRNWDRFGHKDPLWAIMSDPSKRGGRWDEDEFFATGRAEVEGVIATIAGVGHPLHRGAALDFGCGVGRLTQAIAEHFGQTTGLDIAPAMLEHARRYNRHGDRVKYVLHASDDLPFPSGSFDLVYTNMVLQHIRPEASRRYIAEFVRVLAPHGVAVFHIPSERILPAGTGFRGRARRRIASIVQGLRPTIRSVMAVVELVVPRIEMNTIPRADVEAIVSQAGGLVLRAVPDDSGGAFAGFRYFVRRANGGENPTS